MAPQLLFFLARHTVCIRNTSHQFVALGNNYRGPPEVKPGRESSLTMRKKGGGVEAWESREPHTAQEEKKRVFALADLSAN